MKPTFTYGLLLITFALHLHQLAHDSFWGDEILTTLITHQPPSDILALTATDIHPPFYYLFIKIWSEFIISTTPPSLITDWLWRFPSVIVSVLTVALTYRLTAYFFAPNHRLAPVFLLATAPLVFKYSQEARMHALFMGLSVLTTWLLIQALHRHRWPYWLAFTVATAANLYTVYFGFLVLISQLGYVALQPSPRRKAAQNRLLLALLGVSLLYAPWLPVLINLLRHRAEVGAIEGGVGSPLTYLTRLIEALGPRPWPIAWSFLALYLLGITRYLRQRAWPQAALLIGWVGLPTLLPLILGDPRALQFRYAFIMPPYLMGVAQGLSYFITRLDPLTRKLIKPHFIYQYGMWLLVTLSFIATLQIANQTKPNWRAAAAYLDQHARPDDLIIFGPLWDEGRFISYYYHGKAQRLTPAAFVANIDRYAETMRLTNGRLWAVNTFTPRDSALAQTHPFDGVILSELTLNIYEPAILTQIALDLAHQAVEGADLWAEAARAQGVINPDPRTAQAAAFTAWGDALLAAQQPAAAAAAYQQTTLRLPGWAKGYIQLAEAQELAGNLPAAAQAYAQAVTLTPAWQGEQARQAQELAAQSQWAQALELYHQLIKGQ